MVKAALCVVALGLLSVAVSAQDIDCGKAYRSAMDKLKRETGASMAPERLAAMRREALRIYNACETGHLRNPKALFERLDRARE